MAIPKSWSEISIPLMQYAKNHDNQFNTSKVITELAEILNLTEQEKQQESNYGYIIYVNRLNWAKFFLMKAGLFEKTSIEKDGMYRITKQGEQLLSNNPPKEITFKFLKDKYPIFRDYLKSRKNQQPTDKELDQVAPDESIDVPKTTTGTLGIPLNLILYGPPGTGKTFKLINEYFELFSSKTVLTEKIEEFAKSLTWWQVCALIILDNGNSQTKYDIEAHNLAKVRKQFSRNKHVLHTLQEELQGRSIVQSNRRITPMKDPRIFKRIDQKKRRSDWGVDIKEFKKKYPEIYEEFLQKQKEYKDLKSHIDVRRYEFITFHQSFTYEDFIEGIKPILNRSLEDIIDEESTSTDEDDTGTAYDNNSNNLLYDIEDGVFKIICEDARKNPGQAYALFIDEINRGNVAQIFGELITLIEEDKRQGMKCCPPVTLPYSKKPFSVPPNLHIIGTMNSADRSVEALDTALRRRFCFEEMKPKPSLLSGCECYGYNLKDVLETVNARIKVLLDKDHLIGHSYFLKVKEKEEEAKEEDRVKVKEQTFKDIFFNNIIPLLEEYFYGDFGKIELVLGKGFVELEKGNTIIFPECSDQTKKDFDDSEIKEQIIYTIKTAEDFQDDDSFKNALVEMKIQKHKVTAQ